MTAIRTQHARTDADQGGPAPPAGPLDRAAVIVVLRRPVRLRRGDQRRLRLGRRTRKYLFDQRISAAALVTLELTVLSMLIGVVLGVRAGGHAAVAEPGAARPGLGLPLVLPRHPGLRAVGVLGPDHVALPARRARDPVRAEFVTFDVRERRRGLLRSPVIGLGLNEAAYMAEIVRAGIQSVDEGQTEAASALGMTLAADDAADRAAAGDAGDHPADRQRD